MCIQCGCLHFLPSSVPCGFLVDICLAIWCYVFPETWPVRHHCFRLIWNSIVSFRGNPSMFRVVMSSSIPYPHMVRSRFLCTLPLTNCTPLLLQSLVFVSLILQCLLSNGERQLKCLNLHAAIKDVYFERDDSWNTLHCIQPLHRCTLEGRQAAIKELYIERGMTIEMP